LRGDGSDGEETSGRAKRIEKKKKNWKIRKDGSAGALRNNILRFTTAVELVALVVVVVVVLLLVVDVDDDETAEKSRLAALLAVDDDADFCFAASL
jgi:predicted lysophospholipase L1 biosynthesis ABC-type transport system permease subunit